MSALNKIEFLSQLRTKYISMIMHLFVKIQFNRGTFNFFVSLIILKRKQYDLWSIDVRFSETVFSGHIKKKQKM